MLVGVGRDEARIDSKAVAANRPSRRQRSTTASKLTEPPFGTDAHAVADDQHPQHQVGIDRGPADSAVERPQLCTDALQINKPVDAAKQMIPWHIIIEAES